MFFSDQVECHNNVVNTTPTPAEASGLPGKTATACREFWMNACGNSKERERAKHLLHLTYPKYPQITQMREKLLPHDCITLHLIGQHFGVARVSRSSATEDLTKRTFPRMVPNACLACDAISVQLALDASDT